MARKPPSFSWAERPVATSRASPSSISREVVGSPHDRRVQLLGAEAAGDHFDVLVEIGGRLDVVLLEHRLGEAVGTASFRHRHLLAVQPLDGFLVALELRRVGAHQEGVALVPAQSQVGDDADVGHVLLGCGYDGRHVPM